VGEERRRTIPDYHFGRHALFAKETGGNDRALHAQYGLEIKAGRERYCVNEARDEIRIDWDRCNARFLYTIVKPTKTSKLIDNIVTDELDEDSEC
jgi:hypothetical protein